MRLKSRAERSVLDAAPDVAVDDVCLNFLSPKTKLFHHTSIKKNDPSTISAQEACFDLLSTDKMIRSSMYFCDQAEVKIQRSRAGMVQQ